MRSRVRAVRYIAKASAPIGHQVVSISRHCNVLTVGILATMLGLLVSGCTRLSPVQIEEELESTVPISDNEEIVPPCRYSNNISSFNVDLSQSSVSFVLGRNHVYRLPLHLQTRSLPPDEIKKLTFDTEFEFTSIATARNNNDLSLVRNLSDGAVFIIQGEEIEKVGMPSEFRQARITGFSVSPSGD